MAKPNLPYRKELIIGPAEHLGYRYIVAYQADGGLSRKSIVESCAQAAEEKAPKDAICKRGDRWYTRSELVDFREGRRLDSYASALLRHEQELNRQRKISR